MSRTAIGGLALSVLISISVPSQAEETQITIIRPPPLAVNISPPSPREVSVVTETHDNRSVNQAVAITIVTVTNPYYGYRYRWLTGWDGRYDWAGYGLRGGTAVYNGPRYPF